MQTKKPCVCGRAYWPNQAWQHKGCATNGVATNSDATNTKTREGDSGSILGVVVAADAGGEAGVSKTTANRRSRESYNAYQREYMRKRRAL